MCKALALADGSRMDYWHSAVVTAAMTHGPHASSQTVHNPTFCAAHRVSRDGAATASLDIRAQRMYVC